MLAAQAAVIVQLARGRTGRPELVLAGLGAAMVPGYLGEALVRRRLRRSGFDGVETPIAAIGLGLAAAMVGLGMASWTRSRSVTRRGEPPLARAE
jgi:hypothetical protein